MCFLVFGSFYKKKNEWNSCFITAAINYSRTFQVCDSQFVAHETEPSVASSGFEDSHLSPT